MKLLIAKCDICNDTANIEVRFDGKSSIVMNTRDGHGDYMWVIDNNTQIDLCQQHKSDITKFLTKICGKPIVEKEIL